MIPLNLPCCECERSSKDVVRNRANRKQFNLIANNFHNLIRLSNVYCAVLSLHATLIVSLMSLISR